MKAHYRTKSGRIVFEVQSDTAKGIFQSIAEVQEVFEADERCGCCDSDWLNFRVRHTSDKSDYYEMVCRDCGAALRFGQHKSGGTLFVKRFDEQHMPLPNRGWSKFQRLTAGESRHAS